MLVVGGHIWWHMMKLCFSVLTVDVATAGLSDVFYMCAQTYANYSSLICLCTLEM